MPSTALTCACGLHQAVQQFTNLRLLELGSNKIRHMAGLEGLAQLQELWLGRNRIADITSLSRQGMHVLKDLPPLHADTRKQPHILGACMYAAWGI